ncbi:MAG: putative histidine kinase, partial [Cyanobacteria bacterium RYN_339]|nr:putative histidine kinase [Cyanobacteria bacterium RYN_339]
MSTQNGPQELERALATLAASNQAVIQATSEQQLMARLCRVVVEEGRYRMAWIGQACHDPEKRVMPIAQVGDTGAYLKSIQISWANEALGRGPTGDAILTGEPVACNNLQGKPAHHAWSATALQHGFRASIALPFGVGADRFTLNIYAGEPDAFGPHELALLRGVAENLAFGLDHLRHRARQRETEAALRLTAARLTEAQRIACLGYWEWDLRTDALHWSDEIYIIFGLERDHVSAHVTNFDERVHPDDRDTVNRALEAALSGQSGYSLEHRIVRPDGEVRIMQEEGEVTFDPDGKAVRMAGTVQDITERRRVEDELARRTAQLEQARELEKLKNNFVSAVSHELRSPLTVIRGYTEFLEDEAQTPEWRAYLDQIQQATARLERLVDDLLDAARLDAGTFALHLDPTDLATKCKQALESMRRQAEQVGV